MVIFLAAAVTACGSSAETSRSSDADLDATEAAPSPASGEAFCAPDVSGLLPAGIEPIEIDCPRGYTRRQSFAALPIAGRFGNLTELTDAFCVANAATTMAPADPRGLAGNDAIDFETNDVVAYAFDARPGLEPALHRRGPELWLRVTSTTCRGDAPVLASIAFVVPKGVKIQEQKCSLRCE